MVYAMLASSVGAMYADAEPPTQQRIVQAVFEQVEVLGATRVWVYPTVEAEARGWAAAFRGEFTIGLRQSGRGERGSPFVTQAEARTDHRDPGVEDHAWAQVAAAICEYHRGETRREVAGANGR